MSLRFWSSFYDIGATRIPWVGHGGRLESDSVIDSVGGSSNSVPVQRKKLVGLKFATNTDHFPIYMSLRLCNGSNAFVRSSAPLSKLPRGYNVRCSFQDEFSRHLDFSSAVLLGGE
eukprot:12429967-Karenia_brevis.AAC.1